MHRLTPPKLLLYIPFVVVGILLATITPNYLTASRVLSITSLIIGQLGMSFVPVIALFPKANLAQSIILATIYFITTFIICITSWVIYSLGLTSEFAFIWLNEQFHINIASLFVANAMSFGSLFTCFNLIYDQELTKEFHTKSRSKFFRGFSTAGFDRFRQSSPDVSQQKKESSQASFKQSSSHIDSPISNEDFGKPFDFEPEIEISKDSLPSESAGGLYAPPEEAESTVLDFFDDGSSTMETIKKIIPDELAVNAEKNKSQKKQQAIDESNRGTPEDIKKDLNAIFEEYSSLDAIKKITNETTEEIIQKKKNEKKRNDQYFIDGDDVQEATFRQIEEVVNDMPPEALASDGIVKDLAIKEEIFTPEEIEIIPQPESSSISTESIGFSQEELQIMQESLSSINEEENILGSLFLSNNGDVIAESFNKESLVSENVRKSILNIFTKYKKQISKTNQGNLSHLLLESDSGTVALANLEDKILTIISNGKGEGFTAKLLKIISEVEENI